MRQIVFLLIFVFYKTIRCDIETEKEKCDRLGIKTECEENVLTEYLAEIEVTCPESLVGLAVTNFENLCRRVSEALEKFRNYFETCKVRNKEDLYMSLIRGVKTLYKKLCDDPEFARRFGLYYPCLHELRNDFDGCNGPVDWYEAKADSQICKTFQHITDCYFIKTAKVCGIDAAKTIKELMRDIVDSIITENCDIEADPNVRDPMPDSYLCGKAVLELMRGLDSYKNVVNKQNKNL